MSRGTSRKAFTLVEVLVSILILMIGVVSVINALTKMGNDQASAVQFEHMQKLAIDKYDELVATEALQTQALNGDFSDRGDDSYSWAATVNPTGTDNLSALTVTVTQQNNPNGSKGVVNGVVFQPPQTSTTGAGTPGTGGTP